MKLRHALVALSLAGMVATPALGQADRASSPSPKEAEMGGSSVIIAILAIAAVVAAIAIAAGGGDDDAVSP